jgi:hypothetical protein
VRISQLIEILEKHKKTHGDSGILTYCDDISQEHNITSITYDTALDEVFINGELFNEDCEVLEGRINVNNI